MTTTVKVRLKPSMMKILEQKTVELNITSESLITKALEDYFYFERLNALRQELKGYAQQQGFKDEEAVFKAVS